MNNFSLGENLILVIVVIWTVLWKCYSLWTAVKNDNKKWFVALLILNTAGILDMIYIFHVTKHKWSDVKNAFDNLFK